MKGLIADLIITALDSSATAAQPLEGLIDLLLTQTTDGDDDAAHETRMLIAAALGRVMGGLRIARRTVTETTP